MQIHAQELHLLGKEERQAHQVSCIWCEVMHSKSISCSHTDGLTSWHLIHLWAVVLFSTAVATMIKISLWLLPKIAYGWLQQLLGRANHRECSYLKYSLSGVDFSHRTVSKLNYTKKIFMKKAVVPIVNNNFLLVNNSFLLNKWEDCKEFILKICIVCCLAWWLLRLFQN